MDKDARIKELEEELKALTSVEGYDTRKAGSIKRRITQLIRYGVEHSLQNREIRNKMIETNLEKYGRRNGRGFGSEYTTKTMIKKYGAKGTLGSSELRDKMESTMKERYNVNNAGKSSALRNKGKNTVRAKYGVDNVSKSPIIKRKKIETRRKHK